MRARSTRWLLLVGTFGASLANGQSAESQLVGEVFSYVVETGDTLSGIGARYGVNWQVVADENELDSPDALHVGQVLRVDNRHLVPSSGLQTGILINIPQRMLFYLSEGQVTHAYPVAVGRNEWPTPTGTFRIVVRQEDPTWYVPSSIQEEMRRAGRAVVQQVPPCSENPLGAYWLGLDASGYGIHGTNAPTTIYSFGTHGCIRLHPTDIEALFPMASVDTVVEVVYEPILVALLEDGRAFLEVHEDLYGVVEDGQQLADRLIQESGIGSVNPDAMAEILERREGLARLLTHGAERATASP